MYPKVKSELIDENQINPIQVDLSNKLNKERTESKFNIKSEDLKPTIANFSSYKDKPNFKPSENSESEIKI